MRKITTVLISILFLAVVACAQVTVKIDSIDVREDDQTVYLTVTRAGIDYEFHADTPIMNEISTMAYLRKHSERYAVLILGKMYREADWKRFKTEDNSNLEAFKDWIADGHKNLIGQDENGDPIYQIIEKKNHKSTHPKWIKLEQEIDAINSWSEMRAFLKKIIRRIK